MKKNQTKNTYSNFFIFFGKGFFNDLSKLLKMVKTVIHLKKKNSERMFLFIFQKIELFEILWRMKTITLYN